MQRSPRTDLRELSHDPLEVPSQKVLVQKQLAMKIVGEVEKLGLTKLEGQPWAGWVETAKV